MYTGWTKIKRGNLKCPISLIFYIFLQLRSGIWHLLTKIQEHAAIQNSRIRNRIISPPQLRSGIWHLQTKIQEHVAKQNSRIQNRIISPPQLRSGVWHLQTRNSGTCYCRLNRIHEVRGRTQKKHANLNLAAGCHLSWTMITIIIIHQNHHPITNITTKTTTTNITLTTTVLLFLYIATLFSTSNKFSQHHRIINYSRVFRRDGKEGSQNFIDPLRL